MNWLAFCVMRENTGCAVRKPNAAGASLVTECIRHFLRKRREFAAFLAISEYVHVFTRQVGQPQ